MANLQRVYVWELPVRLYHWVNALCVTVLAVTGFMIGRPFFPHIGGEAWQNYSFGWVRFVHFTAAFVFFFNFLGRIYWGFVGNEHARWHQFLPFGKGRLRRQAKEIGQVLRVDVLLAKDESIESVGHNALAGVTYFATFLVFLFQSLTKMRFEPAQVITTLENRMKCGIGICGRCNVGPFFVCRDGPVLTWEKLNTLPKDF